MGKKLRAAKASLVAAFVAAGGAATAKALPARSSMPANTIGGASSINWGDQLIRFLKLDGFPAYLKTDGSERLALFYKVSLLTDASALYEKWGDRVADLLALYNKANAGPLGDILVDLEAFAKYDKLQPLLDYLKTPGALDAYAKFTSFFAALQDVSRDEKDGGAFAFFYKETGITELPVLVREEG
jgi:hypothetical protein